MPLRPSDRTIAQALIAVAWGNGVFADAARSLIDGFLVALHASPDESAALRDYARTPRSLSELDLAALTSDDRAVLYGYAIEIAPAHGEEATLESVLLTELARRLALTQNQAHIIATAATERAVKHRRLRT